MRLFSFYALTAAHPHAEQQRRAQQHIALEKQRNLDAGRPRSLGGLCLLHTRYRSGSQCGCRWYSLHSKA
jgi:hypothetical protein